MIVETKQNDEKRFITKLLEFFLKMLKNKINDDFALFLTRKL